jgi:hypothetical protein
MIWEGLWKREPRPRNQKTPSNGESGLSGCRDLNSGPHGPEPVSVFWNCSPHGLVIFITMWSTFLGNRVDYNEPKMILGWVEN